MNKRRHCVLSVSLTSWWVHSVWYKWYKWTPYDSYFTKMVLGSFCNGPVIIKRKLCVRYPNRLMKESFYKVPVSKSRHYVSDNLLTWSWVHLVFYQWFNNHFVCVTLRGWLWVHLVLYQWKQSDTRSELF